MSGAGKAAVYARVSTEDQHLDGQVRELEREAERLGIPIIARYVEKVSGTGKVERKEYARLHEDARRPERPWSHLLVWSLDRFSREERFTKAIEAVWDLEAAGIRFHSLSEPMLDTPSGSSPSFARELLLALTPVLASWEARRRSERTRVAMAELKSGRRNTRSGRPVGRPPEITPELLGEIRRLREQRFSWAQIAIRVHKPLTSCRKWYSAARKAGGTPPGFTCRVINGIDGSGAGASFPSDVGGAP